MAALGMILLPKMAARMEAAYKSPPASTDGAASPTKTSASWCTGNIDESPVKTQQHRYRFVTERAPHQNFVHVLFKRPSSPPVMGTLGRMGTFSLARQFGN